jgi:hypothetical protein
MTQLDQLIDDYFKAKTAIHQALGYRPDWVEIPMEDHRADYWMLSGGDGYDGTCVYSDEPFTEASITKGDKIYSGSIYTQRFLPKWVYRTDTHAMVAVDTHTDGNKFLMLFDASKECTDEKMRRLYEEKW